MGWIEEIKEMRRNKDIFFKEDSRSPLPPDKKKAFKGLNYYPIDPKYRFVLPLHEHGERETLRILDTAGFEREYIRWGEFRFEVDGKKCKLQAYKDSPDDTRLFVPFRDRTNGEETYGAGRYIDLHEETDKTPDGKWILDFNKAYNPWCAYNSNYACPFVPPENWLDIPIYAGEKKFDE